MIKIEDLIPLLKKGWVAMDENETWAWYATKPFIQKKDGIWQVKRSVTNTSYDELPRNAFDIAPADDWTKSLIKVKGVILMTWDDFLSYIERHYDTNSWDDSPKYVCISSEGNHWVKFYKNGDVCVDDGWSEEDITIAEHRSYEQMLKMIEGLLG